MASENTVDRALKGLGSTLVSARNLVRKATVDFGHAHEPRHKRRVALITSLCCGLLAGSLLLGGAHAPIEHVEKPLQSARVRLLEGNTQRSPDILIVNIDDASLAYGDSGRFGQESEDTARSDRYAWPWPRSVYNKIIRYCREGGARVVVFDLVFSESGPNTNQPVIDATVDGKPLQVWTFERAGDDLFILEAAAREDVAVAITAESSQRRPELRDRLLAAYALKGDHLPATVRQRFAPYNSGTTPIAGLLDGIPDFVAEARTPTLSAEERLEYVRGYEDAVNGDADFARRANRRSLLPLARRERVQGIGGAGVVNVFSDVDGRVRAMDLFGYVGEQPCRSLALEAYRLFVLSHAREAQTDASKRADFARRFEGLIVDDQGLRAGTRRHDLSLGLRDVPIEFEGDEARYLGCRVALDAEGRIQLRYRNFMDYRDTPGYRLAPETYFERGGREDVFALYPSVSARDMLRDYDARHANARRREFAALVERLTREVAEGKAEPAALEEARRELQALPSKDLDLLLGQPPELVKGKIVIVAGSAAALYDAHATPLDPNTPGTWIVATALDNLLQGDVMHEQPRWQVWLFAMFAVVLGVNVTLYARRTLHSLLALATLALLAGAAAWLAFSMQHWFHVSGPLASLFIGFAGGSLAKALTEGRQKAQREAFARQYMGTELVEHVIARPDALKLGGENRHMTIYFSDVAGFTTLTETLGPEHPDRLVELLNIYLERMTDIMLESGGVIDKYIGDALMCFWGAPRDMEDHAVRACKGALACKVEMARMQPLFADAVRATAPQLIKPDGTVLSARAGLNSGLVTVGNMGSSKRFAYTVMGDAVNLASRLEGQNKEYGSWIMIGENTEKLIRGEFTTRRLDLIVVKGKTKPTEVFELLGPKDVPQFIQDLRRDFERGVEMFRARQFEAALEWFKTSLQNEPDKDADNPSALYIERCQHFVENPPPAEWNGVFIKKSK